jgi:thioredoxin reductase (NADPH)
MGDSIVMTSNHYDVMIIGTGPAGITAALYGVRLGLNVVVFGDIPGGNTYIIESLDNFPGFPGGISGTQFGVQAFQQAEQEGAAFTMTRLQQLSEEQGLFKGTDIKNQNYTSTSAIIATGRIPKRLKVPNANLKGVHFCSLCDGPLYRGKNAILAVIGSDNGAGQHALTLARIADKVLLVNRSKGVQMDAAITNRINEQNNISMLSGTEVIDYEGDETIEGIVVKNQEVDRKIIAVDGVFLTFGWQTNTKMLHMHVEKTTTGYLKTDEKFMTSCPGLFAAGDVRDSDMYQVLTACADGARAAKYCSEFLEEKKSNVLTSDE